MQESVQVSLVFALGWARWGSTIVLGLAGQSSAFALGGAGRLGSIVLKSTWFWVSVASTLTMQDSVQVSLVVVLRGLCDCRWWLSMVCLDLWAGLVRICERDPISGDLPRSSPFKWELKSEDDVMSLSSWSADDLLWVKNFDETCVVGHVAADAGWWLCKFLLDTSVVVSSLSNFEIFNHLEEVTEVFW